MADMPRMALMALLRTAAADPDVDFLREALRVLTQELMEAEVEAHLGADRYERTSERNARASAMATAPGTGTRGWAVSPCGCHASEIAVTSPHAWNHAPVPSGRW